ncbi:MAG: 50S ribosomal protein L23 [Flavobacteriales bacterium]|nr:50S ribosomal protein L23 [Flavobacteriales bacterium]
MDILIRPLITEKMTAITDKSGRYGFIVTPDATKDQIKAAIEKVYNVTVISVNTIRYAGKARSRYTKAGVVSGRTNAFKKAIVKIADGQVIDFYNNI